jgi:hypothetical protein
MEFRKTIGDSWKVLQGFTMQHKENQSGYSVLTFTKQVDNVILGIKVKANDDGTTEISNEYIEEIVPEEEYYGTV